MSFECGQQRVMRPGWERPRPLASWRVLTNRMREYFTYGSVGGAGGNSGPYPAANAGALRWPPNWTHLAARIAQFWRYARGTHLTPTRP